MTDLNAQTINVGLVDIGFQDVSRTKYKRQRRDAFRLFRGMELEINYM